MKDSVSQTKIGDPNSLLSVKFKCASDVSVIVFL